MIFGPIHAHRLKGSKPHVQGDLCRLDATISYARKNFLSKVQPCGWRRYRTTLVGVDGLIAVPIAGAVRPVNVRWQRHMPQPLDQTKEICCRRKAYAAFPETAPGHDLCLQFVFVSLVLSFIPVSKEQPLSHSNFAPWADQALPFVWFLRYLPGEQYLDPTLEKVVGRRILRTHGLGLRAASPAVKACRKDPRVIKHNQVIRMEQVGEVAKPAVSKPSRGAAYLQ